MGQLSIPSGSLVYIDTAPVIYSVEKHTDYWDLLIPLWQAAKEGEIELFTSGLTLLEVLVQPLRQEKTGLVSAYEDLLTNTEIILQSITIEILRKAAGLRASENFKTPDAIHAASALASRCTHFVTNDPTFKRLSIINAVILRDL